MNGKEFRFPDQPLFKYTFSPEHQQLGFCLYMHSIGSFQVAWMQAKWIVSVLAGKISLPSKKDMQDQAVALEEHQGKGVALSNHHHPGHEGSQVKNIQGIFVTGFTIETLVA